MAAGGHDGTTMSDTHDTPQAAEEPHGSVTDHDGGHGPDSHGDDGHGPDGHGHLSEPLGPIGWSMWGVGVLGILVALVMTVAFAYSTGFVLGA